MEHFIRIAFWIVTLAGCLPAQPLPIGDSNIKSMQQRVKCPSDATFYTPSNVDENCNTTALDCFMKELKGTVKEECEAPSHVIDQAVEFLERVIENLSGQAPNNSCKDECEMWPTRNFSSFLYGLESLLQRGNS